MEEVTNTTSQKLYEIPNDHTLEHISEHEFEQGEDAPTSMASDMTVRPVGYLR